MQIVLTTQCMTDGQVYSGDEHMPSAKSDADFYFIPDSSIYYRSYLVGWIKIWI